VNVLDLFSGIGGFSLGLERVGFRTVQFVEIDEWCRSRLAKNWPGMPIHDDIRTFHPSRHVHLVCGGFPCTDVSSANTQGKGIDGEQSGLVWEMLRVIGEARPDWVVIENSPNLRTRGADRVLDELERQGYACWPLVVGARHVGAPHRRDRVWLIAHRTSDGHQASNRYRTQNSDAHSLPGRSIARGEATHADIESLRQQSGRRTGQSRTSEAELGNDALTNSKGQSDMLLDGQVGGGESTAEADGEPWGYWNSGPSAHLQLVDGLSTRMARRHIAAYGNAVVPRVVEAIGRAICRLT